jgi:signal recognition particle subunit SEC65
LDLLFRNINLDSSAENAWARVVRKQGAVKEAGAKKMIDAVLNLGSAPGWK